MSLLSDCYLKITNEKISVNTISSPVPVGIKNKKYTGPPRLTCTHCGEKILKPNIPVNYIINCDKCFRPFNLPDKYYKNKIFL
jgi:hypothetical protein